MALASGDDVLTAETREMLGPLETVTVKTAFSRSAAAVLPPATVHRLLRQAAARAVRRVKAGELRPLTMEKPYRVRFCLRTLVHRGRLGEGDGGPAPGRERRWRAGVLRVHQRARPRRWAIC